jgi:hypothetical protein
MYSLSSQELEVVSGDESFEGIFRIPSCDSALSNRLQELSTFKEPEQTHKLKLDPTDEDSTCKHSVRKCHSISTDGTTALNAMLATSKDDCVEFMHTYSSMRAKNRALYNFRVGLLTHEESMQAKRKAPVSSRNSGSVCVLASSGCRSQDGIWDLLLE